jgi:hypothetical protein
MTTAYTRTEVLDLLRSTVVTVNFTKADGSKRDMKCTLLVEHIPANLQPKDDSKKMEWPDDVLRVFDIEKGAWRSFRLDSINSVTV